MNTFLSVPQPLNDKLQRRLSAGSGMHTPSGSMQQIPNAVGGPTVEPTPPFPVGSSHERHQSVFHADAASSEHHTSERLSGWTAMADLVRRNDDEKINSYKEDIDTLLVFAGLFATAVTAFLIVSLQSLQKDTSVESVQILRQIALQTSSYSLKDGMLHTAVNSSLPLSQDFQPSAAAVKINVLWFASLIASLITASMGMLVKQWLREYTSVDNPSPRERLRVRYFRSSGLSQWGIFEIAAVLPLLLQVALGLFLAGLCYFTFEAHYTVGITSVVLVVAWAFFLVVTVFAPAFSSRCPYKTKFCKNVFATFRCWFYGILNGIFASMETVNFPPAILHVINSICDWARRRTPQRYPQDRPFDEQDAVKFEEMDHQILLAVDELHADDELLGSTMKDALVQLHPPPHVVVQFVEEIIRSRLPSFDRGALWTIDLCSLSWSSWTAITTLVAHFIDEIIRGEYKVDKSAPAASIDLMGRLIPILLCRTPHKLPICAVKVVRKLLKYERKKVGTLVLSYNQLSKKRTTGHSDSHLLIFLDRLQALCEYPLLETSLLLLCLEEVVCLHFTTYDLNMKTSSIFTVKEPQRWLRRQEISTSVCQKVAVVLSEMIYRDYHNYDHEDESPPWTSISTDLFHAILGIFDVCEEVHNFPLQVPERLDQVAQYPSAYIPLLSTVLHFGMQRHTTFLASTGMANILQAIGRNTEAHCIPQLIAWTNDFVTNTDHTNLPAKNVKLCYMLLTMFPSSASYITILEQVIPVLLDVSFDQDAMDLDVGAMELVDRSIESLLRFSQALHTVSRRSREPVLIEGSSLSTHPIELLIQKLHTEVKNW